jgi:ceramide glucosyltransferase
LTAVRIVTLLATVASLAYAAFSIASIRRFRRQLRRHAGGCRPAITVLKPVHGMDSQLYDNLRSFCEQDYPEYQVVFAAADQNDPAVAVVRRLIGELPERDLSLVTSDREIGSNRKISNVANAYALAKHDMIVIADSDMRVGPDYLTQVAAGFEEKGVGAVTCLYVGVPSGDLASKLGSMFINESFLPSVLVALRLQDLKFCFGATMAMRRQALDDIGGFEALASYLADDYMLGKLVSDRGYKVNLAPYVVKNVVFEPDLKSLLHHELRWSRTVRTVRPVGYAFSVLTQPLPLSLLLLALHPAAHAAFAVVAALVLRIAQHYTVRKAFGIPGPAAPWLVPVRDLLYFAVWAASFLGRDVQWRDAKFAVTRNGQMTLTGEMLP